MHLDSTKTFGDIKNAKYIALETFRKNGQGVITPVWMVEDGGKFYVWTDGTSGKAKRIRSTGRVRLCASDARGKPQSSWVDAQARVLNQPADVKATEKRMAAKYGLLFHLFGVMGKITGRVPNRVTLEISPLTGS